jgi:hypothetical protein
MKGYTFDCSDGRQSVKYNVAMKELAEYGGRKYTYGGDIHWTIDNNKMFPMPMPEDVATDANKIVKHIWEHRINEYVKRDNQLYANCETYYSLTVGHTT